MKPANIKKPNTQTIGTDTIERKIVFCKGLLFLINSRSLLDITMKIAPYIKIKIGTAMNNPRNNNGKETTTEITLCKLILYILT